MKTLALLLTTVLTTAGLLSAAPTAPEASTVRLFKVKCAGCHGVDGAGGVGASLKHKLAHHSYAQLCDVIKNGIPGTQMPPSGLPDEQVKKLASYVQFLNKH